MSTRRPRFFVYVPDLWDLILLVQVIAYVILCPYTKVEESFNTQATFDLIHAAPSVSPTLQTLKNFDHNEFPGVVPRTFLGPSVLATFAAPIYSILSKSFPTGILDFESQELGLVITRVVLGVLAIIAQGFFRASIRENIENGKGVSTMYAVITMCQFHLLFYASRPLPNTFALILVWLAYGYWVRSQPSHMFAVLALAAVIFRSDVFVLIGPIALVTVVTKQISIFKGAIVGIFFMVLGVALSVLVDSFYWGRIVWPEGEVFYFNTILNKSSEWGTEPFHWYFTSALPRALLATALFIPLGISRSTAAYLVSAVAFVGLYSVLPHKELRFILMAVPLFNLVAAVGLNNIQRRSKALFGVALIPLAASLAASTLILLISVQNYPGAHALKKLHQIADNNELKYVHMDPETCMTGVSRFVQKQDPLWKYSKQESNFSYDDFTHLITGNASVPPTFELIYAQQGFSHLDRKNLKIETAPKIFVFEKKQVDIASEASGEKPLSPIVKWAQRTDKLYITIELYESHSAQVILTTDNRHLLFKAGSRGKTYALDLHLHAAIQPFVDRSKQVHFGKRWIKIMLFKAEEDAHFWPRLLADKFAKPAFLKIDWDNWMEDEGDEAMAREESWIDVVIEPKAEKSKLVAGHGTTLTVLKELLGNETSDEMIAGINQQISDLQAPPFEFAVAVTAIVFILMLLLHCTAYSRNVGNPKQKKE